MLHRLYDWTLDLAGHRHALAALAAVAFIESSVFPVPPDMLIIPMVLAARTRAWKIAAVATVASALGGLAGYGIGAGLYEVLGRFVIEFYGLAERFQEIRGHYNEWGGLIVFTAGFSPIPYKVFTIASGVTGMNLAVFLVASIV
jgi:membrane protein YqaA with SNARE-associated domain